MLKQNQRSGKISQKLRNPHLNRALLLCVVTCLSVSLMTSASAKELRINLTESLNMSSNDKKPKDLPQKAKPKENTKAEKKEVKKPEKPKPIVKAKPTETKKKLTDTVTKKPTTVKPKLSPTTSTKTKHDTVKNSIGNIK